MRKRKTVVIAVSVIAAIAIFVGAFFGIRIYQFRRMITPREPVISNDPNLINVALYPYVPDMKKMELLCEERFKESAPEVKLNFVDWDCYNASIPDNVDVVMYDALFYEGLINDGKLMELNTSDHPELEEFMPFTIDGATVTEAGKEKIYGIPNLICAYFLIYRDGDHEIAQVNNISELYKVIGDSKGGLKPPRGNGFFSDYTHSAPFYYIESVLDGNKPYEKGKIGDNAGFVEEGVRSVDYIKRMTGDRQAEQSDYSAFLMGSDYKTNWFKKGRGRAMIGYSEIMSPMEDIIGDLNIKLISMGDGPNKTYFYTDFVSITTCVKDQNKLENCKKLVNLLCSYDYILDIGLNDGSPAYMLPANDAMYEELAEHYPMYRKIKAEIDKSEKYVHRYGPWFEDYLNELYDNLENQVDMEQAENWVNIR